MVTLAGVPLLHLEYQTEEEDSSPVIAAAFHFLEPLAPSAGNFADFDASLLNYLLIEVCELNSSDCQLIKTFTAQNSSSEQLRIETSGQNSYYVVNWDTQKAKIRTDKSYRIRVVLARLELGWAY
jgi:hypothetical protein